MYSSLQPELRGAQRILRSISYRSPPTSRLVVRSFNSYTRLQAKSNPASSPDNTQGTSKGWPSWIPRGPWFPKPEQENAPVANDGKSARGRYWPALSEQELQAIAALQQDNKPADSKPPAGFTWIEHVKDLPTHLKDRSEKPQDRLSNQDLYPFFYSENPQHHMHHEPVPMVEIAHQWAYSPKQPSKDVSDDDSKPQESKHHGSWQKRRRRAHEQKLAPKKEGVPKWFYSSNIVLSEPRANATVDAITTTQPADGISTSDVTSLDQPQEQVQKPVQESTKAETDEKKRSLAKGREPPPRPDSPKPTPIVPTSYITNTKSLSNDRYFIEAAQYEELVNTFKGRFSSPAKSSKDRNKAFAMNHLTILHGAPDSELLLNALVLDLCSTVGADRVRLDAQDISELMAGAEVDPEIKESGGRLSFRLYKDLYGSSDTQDFMFPRREDEDGDEEDDDGDSGPPSIEIPIGSFVSASGRKGPFAGIFESLDRMGGPMRNRNRSMGDGPQFMKLDTDQRAGGMFDSIVQSILSSSTQAQKMREPQKKRNDTDDQQQKHQPEEEDLSTQRPLVVHFENYRLLQQHQMAEAFMGELLIAADKRRAQGQPIMIIGTDSLRSDFHKSSSPRSILDVQENKSYGVSTAIILTPVFPTREAEVALSGEDRKARIRTVNARHLHQVLKSRGVLLHGLEDGFWNTDFRQEMGERDFEALSGQYWPFVQVQRIAALIAGMQSATPIEDACQILIASDESKVAWAQRNQPDIVRQEQKEAEKERERQDSKPARRFRFSTTRHEKKLLSGVVEPNKISTTFSDIHIPADTVEALKMLTTLSLQRPEAFSYGVLKSDRIPGLLLYGPPGTGKTLAAKAVAKESGATMLEVSAADLNDMYVGEGEKNVQALFSLARKLSPCVVFLDEADAMFSARSTGKRASHREILNQFLKEWDGMSNDSGSAFLMVATNRPMDLDDAVLRRLPRRLLVDLPTEQDRLKILQIHLRNEELDSNVDLADLAKKTPFYSGSDLKNVAVAAALNAVREENEAAATFRAAQASKPEDEQEEYKYPEKRVLTANHFEKALEEIGASISQDMSSLREIKKFDEQYGDRKGRKRKAPKWGFKSAKEADQVLDTVKVRN
ncbi:hypothetical protein LTR64_000390 [Lithohypha guttulata]|uniref:uncharacterized protein n=1 Tax=Lithohypha guttulata TaxID=1690604 RepID=UPI002DDF5600|nr:hypothetical protein LTR51_005842 [Lithohypha guttulata]